jgi:hypothetical protein
MHISYTLHVYFFLYIHIILRTGSAKSANKSWRRLAQLEQAMRRLAGDDVGWVDDSPSDSRHWRQHLTNSGWVVSRFVGWGRSKCLKVLQIPAS